MSENITQIHIGFSFAKSIFQKITGALYTFVEQEEELPTFAAI